MIFLLIACGLFTTGFVIAVFKLFLFKKDIRQLGSSINEIAQTDTNAQLRTSTFDKDMVVLIVNINNLINKCRLDYINTLRSQTELKQAITNISHDLRTPLTSARGYLQMLMNGQLDKVDIRYLAVIQERLDSLGDLLEGFFAFSRALEGNLNPGRVNVCNILRDVLSNNFMELESKGFTVESEIPDSPVYMNCDESALERIIQNLIKNACEHGKNHLWVRLIDGKIEIANNVEKPGEIDIHRIFERFYTMDASRSNKRTGLGLAIAKELAVRMNGKISASMENDVFTVIIELPEV